MRTNQKLIESKFAENFANELKNLQKEGLFENVSSFDLNFNGKGINIKLNEGYPAYRKDSPKIRDANADVDEVLANYAVADLEARFNRDDDDDDED